MNHSRPIRVGLVAHLLTFTVVLSGACQGACSGASAPDPAAAEPSRSGDPQSAAGSLPGQPSADALGDGEAEAVFAGGCFWCMEGPFEELDGVLSVTSGYTGGHVERPTYEQIGTATTGHVEAVRIVYDPSRISYSELLEVFWHQIDPTQDDGQFCDRGPQYRSAIFVQSEDERLAATESRTAIAAAIRGAPVVTEIRDSATFWVAESYHQDFYRENPLRYRSYRAGCGRDRRLRELWGESGAH